MIRTTNSQVTRDRIFFGNRCLFILTEFSEDILQCIFLQKTLFIQYNDLLQKLNSRSVYLSSNKAQTKTIVPLSQDPYPRNGS